ncbi:hypothetical protein BCD67_05070 [Oscillatoriales cyanobacterium USR001]|nr:hypothetical protein BCD67_05070 [Oscillatoriales cyanobacterium USR001]
MSRLSVEPIFFELAVSVKISTLQLSSVRFWKILMGNETGLGKSKFLKIKGFMSFGLFPGAAVVER